MTKQEAIKALEQAGCDEEVNDIIQQVVDSNRQENGHPIYWASHVRDAWWYFPLPDEWKDRARKAIDIISYYLQTQES